MIHAKSQKGFTIIELLIVIVVIGILAAIVVASFTGITNNARQTAFRTDLNNIAKKIELAKATAGVYPTELTAAMDIRINKSLYDTSENNLYYCQNSTTGQYVITARDTKRLQYKMINGVISTQASPLLYGSSSCSEIGTTWATSTGLGYDFNGGTGWSAWAKS